MKGYIRVGHLVYMIIIAVIILSFFLVIAFGGSENASTKIGTASTVSSLILSVIAILMSLVDVAGQRQQIVDLKETSEQLALSNEGSQKLIENLMTKIDEISLLKDSLLEQIKTNEEWKEEIKSLIENPEGKKPEDLSKILEEIVKKNDQSKSKVRELDDRVKNYQLDNRILNYLKNSYVPGLAFPKMEVVMGIARDFEITKATTFNVLEKLEQKGEIMLGEKFIKIL
ncbi:hypothetical protein ABEY41_03060 [Peribacillus butanolivorans]|uniref:hypothetical protein n=1 Tax=Peribacillus butanolivorans TaxID=421767 RepID=UPI003D284E77